MSKRVNIGLRFKVPNHCLKWTIMANRTINIEVNFGILTDNLECFVSLMVLTSIFAIVHSVG